MTAGPLRDDGAIVGGIARWLAECRPDLATTATAITRPATGWSNETVIVDTDRSKLVVRLPALVASYPHYDLAGQAAVLIALSDAGLPAPAVLALELGDHWLGAPFLVMACVEGRAAGEVPALDPFIVDAPPATQRAMHEQFFDAIAGAHALDLERTRLRHILRTGLDAELDYWTHYIAWATDGAPPSRLVGALAWCRANQPPEPSHALLWGDARLGNAMYDNQHRLVALLDWELATIGPPEMDLAWYLVLDDLVTRFVGRVPPGFLDRAAVIARHELHLGRRLEHLEWHEVFALVRSIAVNDCQARLADRHGVAYPGVAGDANPILDVLAARTDACR